MVMASSETDRINKLSEEEFTKEYVIPLLTQLGYRGLRYTHGTSEYGMDVVGYELTKLGTRRYIGVQVKKGGIRGTVKVQAIISQARASFTNPFKDVITLDEHKINELYVISSGRITHNAKNQILNGVIDLKGTIHFLDSQDVLDYLYKEKPDDVRLDLNSYFSQVFDLLNEKYREVLSNNGVKSFYSMQYYLKKLKLQKNCTVYYINITAPYELQIGTHQFIPLTKGMTCLIFQKSARKNIAIRYSNYTTLQDYMYLVQTKSIINIPEYFFIEGEDYQVFFFDETIESIQPEQMAKRIFSSQLKNAEISKSEYEKKNAESITNIDLYESESIEFKIEFPPNARDIAKTLVAFSNTDGGKIYFGIDDDGFIVGVDEIDKIQIRIVNLARKSCEPPLHPRFSTEKIDGKDILIVSVESSNCVHRTNDGRYYKRVGSASVDLSVDELEKLILKRRLL